MILNRIGQVYLYIFGRYDEIKDSEVKKILSKKEFEIFEEMTEYDKNHSYRLYKLVQKNMLLKDDKLYLKLALLHDCGKGKVGLIPRIKKVLVGDKKLENHSEIAFEKLKDINLELAILCKNHHLKNYEKKMEEFQKLDDK